jgi:biopolymer transport protein ExbB
LLARVYDLFIQGGAIMYPLLSLSVLTIASALKQSWFWFKLLRQENQVAREVLEIASYDLAKAAKIAEQSKHLPIGRFLLAPLKLKQPTPETFRLALESAGDREFAKMRKGNKLMETAIALAPLLGLLGTVNGLMLTFGRIKIGDGNVTDATKAAAGIGEALITTATGMAIAIVALVLFRIFVTLQAHQIEYFAEIGSELELLYRQFWDRSMMRSDR